MNIGLDSKFYKFANIVYNIIIINMLMLIGYSSILFSGTFQSISDYICKKNFTKEDYRLKDIFKKYFFGNFKNTIVFSLMYMMILISFIIVYFQNKSEIYFILFTYINTFFCIFTYITGNYNSNLKNTVKNSLSILNLHFYVIIINYGLIKLLLILLSKNIFLFLVIGIGLHKYIIANILYIVINKISKTSNE